MQLKGREVTPDSFMVKIYQVDDDNDGLTPTQWSGGNFQIPAGTVQLLELTPNATGIKTHSQPLNNFALLINYPNPFNNSTKIEFSVPKKSFVTLEILNINGEKIRTLLNESIPSGNHSVIWNGRDDRNAIVASGVYFCRLKGLKIKMRKIILLR